MSSEQDPPKGLQDTYSDNTSEIDVDEALEAVTVALEEQLHLLSGEEEQLTVAGPRVERRRRITRLIRTVTTVVAIIVRLVLCVGAPTNPPSPSEPV